MRRLWVRVRFSARGSRLAAFASDTVKRFVGDDGMRLASGLSYASLLALVPLLAIALAILTAFPVFDGVEKRVISGLFEEFLPRTDAQMSARFETFIDNATKLTAPGIMGLAATALLLLSNINGAFNTIWRVHEPRPLATRVLVYWTLLTFGPLLLGGSISVTSYFFASIQASGLDSWGGLDILLTRGFAVALAAVGFGVIFYVAPNRRVHAWHAVLGGLVAAVLFEVLKGVFALYLSFVPGYQAVYGALASIPIFLVWLFLVWCVVLLGAEVAAGLPEWRAARARGHARVGPGGKLALALAVMGRLRAGARKGRQLKREEATRGLPVTPAEIDEVANALREAGFIARAQGGRWVLSYDLSVATLGDLLQAIGLSLALADGWPTAVRSAVEDLRTAHAPLTELTVAEVLDRTDQPLPRVVAGGAG
ncbi:YihY family inner membrane protein [Rhodovibrio sodomensis]|uniref:YihY family inner membrane protein n=1 Tax=Rhodovibrio sodomensis TaxID=1088 RepID=UPI001903B962|nr:YihY family inner membrane protein [Rhodovibrio sodomensis]